MIKYYNIDTALAKQLRLSGAEKDVFFALRGFRGGVTASQSVLAADLCMMRKTFNNAVTSLLKKGLITATKNGRIYTYNVYPKGTSNVYPKGTSNVYPKGTSNVYPKGTSTCTEKVQVLSQMGTDTCTEKVQDTLYIQDIIKDNIRENIHAHTYEEERLKEMQNLGKTYPTQQLAEELKAELTTQTTTAQAAQQMFGRPAAQLAETVDLFIAKLNLDGETYKNRGDFRRHWQSWLKLNINNIFNNNGNSINNNSISADYIARTLQEAAGLVQPK